MYNVHQHWDPLKVCVVGKSYPPEFYDFIENARLRELFKQIATETEEDFQLLIATLEKFGVEVIRPNVPTIQLDEYLTNNKRIPGPISMTPRDQMIMIGNNFFVFPYDNISVKASGRTVELHTWEKDWYNSVKGSEWPDFDKFENMPQWIQEEVQSMRSTNGGSNDSVDIEEFITATKKFNWWSPITDSVAAAGNPIVGKEFHSLLKNIPSNGITRIGKDLYFGIGSNPVQITELNLLAERYFSDYRCHYIFTDGHIDGCFTPIKPGLIVSIMSIGEYEVTFPGWEVVYLEGESWDKVKGFTDLKEKNAGRWWIKGHEHDDELIEYVETWLNDWVGYAEESVFDVNILVIDEKNIIVNGYNEKAFEAFARHGVTPHICPIRHRYFWDGGIHCVTLDLHREGSMQDYFPERG